MDMRVVKASLQAVAAFAFVSSLALAGAGCAPKYPECTKDDHCKDRGEYCVNKLCKECADDSHCSKNDACRFCGDGYTCQKKAGCCTSDLDCPNGKCWREPGATVGECGVRCKGNEDCPAGQVCKNGQCVPDVECTDDSQCPPGKRCVNGACVLDACKPEAVYFDFDEAALRRDAKSALDGNADCIKKRGQNVLVEGHCDERGSDEYNMALGQRRARSVKKYVEQLGVGVSVRTISYGEERPVCTQPGESCWSQNRRAETSFE